MTFLEKDLEDYICEYPEIIYPLNKSMRILGRQIQMPHGRLDVLAWSYELREHYCYWPLPGLWVIELKAREVTAKDVGQVCRYTYDVADILESLVVLGDISLNEEAGFLNNEKRNQWWDTTKLDGGAIMNLLVGPSFTENAQAACQAAGVHRRKCIPHQDGTFSFEFGGGPETMAQFPEYRRRYLQNRPWAKKALTLLYEAADETIEVWFEKNVEELFGINQE